MRVASARIPFRWGIEASGRARRVQDRGIVRSWRVDSLFRGNDHHCLLICLSVGEACSGEQSAHRLIEAELRIERLRRQTANQSSIEQDIGFRLTCHGA